MLMFTVVALFSADQARLYAADRARVVAELSGKGIIHPITGLQAAIILDPTANEYKTQLAEKYIKQWEPNKAVDLLEDANLESSTDHSKLLLVKNMALLELDKVGEIGERGELSQLVDNYLKATSTGRGQLGAISHVALAQELYDRGMPQAALRTAYAAPDSISKAQLLAQLEMLSPRDKNEALARALQAADRGLQIDATHTTLNELKRSIYAQQKNNTGIEEQNRILNRLSTGKL